MREGRSNLTSHAGRLEGTSRCAAQAAGLPEPNWLPTPDGQSYNLTYRFYGPSQDIVRANGFRRRSLNKSEIRYWHLADMETALENVRFRRQSGHP